MDEIELIDSIWRLVQKSPWGIAPFSDSLLHWEQANKHLACTREVWIWFILSPCWSKTMIRCPADLHGRIKFIKRRPRNGFWKNTNFYGIDLTAAVARCSKPGIWICFVFLMAMPGWHAGFKEVELWILCVGSRGSTSYWAGCLRHIYIYIYIYPSDIYHKSDSSSAWSWCHEFSYLHYSTMFLVYVCHGSPRPKDDLLDDPCTGFLPNVCFLDFLVLHIIFSASLTYP